jgi:hypothetical protein
MQQALPQLLPLAGLTMFQQAFARRARGGRTSGREGRLRSSLSSKLHQFSRGTRHFLVFDSQRPARTWSGQPTVTIAATPVAYEPKPSAVTNTVNDHLLFYSSARIEPSTDFALTKFSGFETVRPITYNVAQN